MSAEEIEHGISVFLQIGALLGILSTAIYLFISLKNYFKAAKEDRRNLEKAHQENIERIKKGMIEDIMKDLGPRIERNISELQRTNELIMAKDITAAENKKRLDDVDKWRVDIEKKFIVIDMQLPTIKSIKVDIETIKNILKAKLS